jgi:WD40 repeat protein
VRGTLFNALAFSPDGRCLLSGSGWGPGGAVQLWAAATGLELRRFAGEVTQARCVGFSPDGRWAVSGHGYIGGRPARGFLGLNLPEACVVDGVARVWDVAVGNSSRSEPNLASETCAGTGLHHASTRGGGHPEAGSQPASLASRKARQKSASASRRVS